MQNKYLVIFLMLTFFLVAKGEEVFNVAVNDAPPYRIVEEGNYNGIYIDIIKEVAKEAGIKLNFSNIPFKRSLEYMKDGQVDIMLGPNKNKEREQFMYFIEECPFPKEEKVFYVADEKNEIKKYEDLYGKTIEVLIGMVYFEKFDKDSKLNKVMASNYKNSILKVANGRSDVVIMPEQEGDYLIKKSKVKWIKSPYTIEGNLSFVAISKKSKNFEVLKEKLTKGMIAIKKKGIYQKIIKSYSED